MNDINRQTNCIEIIGIRLFQPKKNQLVSRIVENITNDLGQRPENSVEVSLYASASFETDWSIHLYHYGEESCLGKTGVGLHIARALSHLGLVHHSVWYPAMSQLKG